MEHSVSGVALEIIKDNDVPLRCMVIEIAQKLDHAGPLHEIALAGHIIRKDGNDRIALGAGVFPAARFLRIEAMTIGHLPLPGHAAVNEGFGWMGGGLGHGRVVFAMGVGCASSSASRLA